ncbi:hypothetical protein BDF22DRAFT_207975 [Syncephalis plumigaleata]|nr:hypothetical protein BDF22DRAFT_207975 [Syncephalis plumigaleata]
MWLFNRLHYQRKLTIHRKWFTLLLLSLLSVLWLERGAILVQADAHYYLDTDKSPMSMEHRMELKNEVRVSVIYYLMILLVYYNHCLLIQHDATTL